MIKLMLNWGNPCKTCLTRPVCRNSCKDKRTFNRKRSNKHLYLMASLIPLQLVSWLVLQFFEYYYKPYSTYHAWAWAIFSAGVIIRCSGLSVATFNKEGFKG